LPIFQPDCIIENASENASNWAPSPLAACASFVPLWTRPLLRRLDGFELLAVGRMTRILMLLLLTVLGATRLCQAQGPTGSTAGYGAEELRPGDVIRLKIWREPDLSGDFTLNESGQVVLPKLGPVDLTGWSPDSVKRWVLQAYNTYLRNPSIEVIALRRINVLGSVRTPGLYSVDPTMTVADVLALAGGATPDGKPDRVQLQRSGKTLMVKVAQATRLVDMPLRSGDQLFVPQRSWSSRNLGLLIGTATATTGLLIRLFTN
jgi:polysaccharide biosynthesis/export protein